MEFVGKLVEQLLQRMQSCFQNTSIQLTPGHPGFAPKFKRIVYDIAI